MPKSHNLNIGLSDYAVTAYLTLLKTHPVNGSQLSRLSHIPRARIYDVVRGLKQKGYVSESAEGQYIPLPPDELLRRLRQGHETDLNILESLIDEADKHAGEDFIWTIRGYDNIMAKARDMIAVADDEIYVRLFAEEARRLDADLAAAHERGVEVKYIAMMASPRPFPLQVIHPEVEEMEKVLGGRSFDLVVDRAEFLGGLFSTGSTRKAEINWGKNHWFVLAGRDSLRHDFFHYFLHKTYHLGQPLIEEEEKLYRLIYRDT